MRIADFSRPHTAAAVGALALATHYQSAAITAHAMRSWFWAEAFAVVENLQDVDHELLYVAAVLHDIGTVAEYDNHTLSYEHAGGHVGVALTTGAGWAAERRQRVLEVIVRHNWRSVDPGLDVEGHLLEIATGLDISGARPDALPQEFLTRGTRSASSWGLGERVHLMRGRTSRTKAYDGCPPPRRQRVGPQASGEPA